MLLEGLDILQTCLGTSPSILLDLWLVTMLIMAQGTNCRIEEFPDGQECAIRCRSLDSPSRRKCPKDKVRGSGS